MVSVRGEGFLGFGITVFGVAVALSARQIPPQPGQVLSAAVPPFLLGLALAGLGLAYAISSLRAQRSTFPIAMPDLLWVFGILVSTGAYVWLFGAIGHLAATVIAAPVLFLLLGCRGWIAAGLVPVVVALLLHVLFFRVMGLYDAPGWLLDLRFF